MSTAAAAVLLPRPASPKYSAIIDAGSSGSRIFLYKWDFVNRGKPLTISKVFPPDGVEPQGVGEGGIQTKGHDKDTMNKYLRPMLEAAKEFLSAEVSGMPRDVPIYLLATGGMRALKMKDQNRILDLAYDVIKLFNSTFYVSHRQITIRVITGELDSLFAWVARNHGRQSAEHLLGLAEMGGASIQFAFEDNSERTENKTRMCLPSKPEGHAVYSATWDGYGDGCCCPYRRAPRIDFLSG